MVHTDEEKLVIHEQQDMQDVVDLVNLQREEHATVGDRRIGQKHMVPVAEIPMLVYNQSIRENWSKEDWRRWINDPENKHFRITDGKF